jgi:hypothetical protein
VSGSGERGPAVTAPIDLTARRQQKARNHRDEIAPVIVLTQSQAMNISMLLNSLTVRAAIIAEHGSERRLIAALDWLTTTETPQDRSARLHPSNRRPTDG